MAASRTLFGIMIIDSQFPEPPESGSSGPPKRRTSAWTIGLISAGVVIGGLLLGLAGGWVWSAIAPRVAFSVISPGSANVVNPETTGFIVGDLAYCLVAAAGGLILGLGGYYAGVRRFGPVPMLAILAGACGAAYLERLIGQRVGLGRFNGLLATSQAGKVLMAPLVLGAQGPNSQALWAMTFWPMLACAAAGALALRALLRERRATGAASAAGTPGDFGWPGGPGDSASQAVP